MGTRQPGYGNKYLCVCACVCVCVCTIYKCICKRECLAVSMKKPFKALMMNNRLSEFECAGPSGVYLNGREMLSHSYQLPGGL